MKTKSMNHLAPLFISISIFMVAGCSKAQENTPSAVIGQQNPMGRQNTLAKDSDKKTDANSITGRADDNDNIKEKDTLSNKQLETKVGELEKKVEDLQREKKGNWLGIPYQVLLAGSTGLIGFTALAIAIARFIGPSKRKTAIKKPVSDDYSKIMNDLRPTFEVIKGRIQKLEQQQRKNDDEFEQIKLSASMSKLKAMRVNTPEQYQKGEPSPAVVSTPQRQVPTGPSKQALIAALNEGDQQKLLRETSSSELNITRESEDDIFTGRAINTELEVVPGGGSYLLVRLQGQSWLFPTKRSLNGFTAVERSKGLFDYEQQTTLSRPQLLEPALLQELGNKWSVKKIGKIGIP